MNGPLDWAVNEMPSDFTIKIFIMAMLVTPCTVITTCLFQRLMWIMTTETETLKKAAAPDFTRYLLFTYNVHTYYYLAHRIKQPIVQNTSFYSYYQFCFFAKLHFHYFRCH